MDQQRQNRPPSTTGDSAPPTDPFFGKDEFGEDGIPSTDSVSLSSKLDEGTVVLRFPDNLSEESVIDLEYWVEGVLSRLRRKAGISKKKPTPDDDGNGGAT